MASLSRSDSEEYYSDLESLEETEEDSNSLFSTSNYQVITKESLLSAQMAILVKRRRAIEGEGDQNKGRGIKRSKMIDLGKVMDLLLLCKEDARALMISYSWDIDKLIAVFLENGSDKLFSEAGLSTQEQSDRIVLSVSSITCLICTEVISRDIVTMMNCGHCYCNECWTKYFIIKINDKQDRRIKCMAHNCKAICNESIIRKLVSARNPSVAKRFERFLLESYIEDSRMSKWCPSVPHCGNAIRVDDDSNCEVECICGLQFCFNCLSEPHSPCPCLMWEHWTKKCEDVSDNVKWIAINTTMCPSCHQPVEKNGGCNTVHCICGRSFCYLCGDGFWSSDYNHPHICYRFIEKENFPDDNSKDACRYIHYYSLFKVHRDSFKLERILEGEVQKKISVLKSKLSESYDFIWILDALYLLFRSKRILSCSYAFSFYMFMESEDENRMSKKERQMKRYLFEEQIKVLELKVKELSKCMKKPFDIPDFRMEVVSLCKTLDKRFMIMYEYIENELLGSLHTHHCIASYRPRGVRKASVYATGGQVRHIF